MPNSHMFANGLVADWKITVNGVTKNVSVPTTDAVVLDLTEGTDAEYTVSITGTLPVNPNAVDMLTYVYISPVVVNSSNWDTITSKLTTGLLTMQASAASLSVDQSALSGIAAAGGSKSVSVSSNDEWTVAIA